MCIALLGKRILRWLENAMHHLKLEYMTHDYHESSPHQVGRGETVWVDTRYFGDKLCVAQSK